MQSKDLDTILYFAYGHNTNTKEFRRRCPSAEYIGVGRLENFRMIFEEFANIQAVDGKQTAGLVWKISRKDLKKLDSDEGLHDHYNRMPVPVHIDNKLVVCATYIMDPAYEPVKMPDKEYVRLLVSGYKEHDLPLKQIADAFKAAFHRL